MPHRSPASSLPELLAALLLAACGDAGDASTGDSTHLTTGTSTSAASTAASTDAPTTDAPVTTTADPGSTGEPTTDAPADTTTAEPGSSTGDAVTCDNMLTWENFGAAFMLSWCTGCHNSQLPTAQRAGAPCKINFDSHAGAAPFAASMKIRAIDWQMYEGVTPMPPAAIVPDDELALLREWIDCGAPGPDAGKPVPSCPDP